VNRALKVAELLKSEISDIIRTRLKDPRVGFVTITNVVLSPDLKNAKVYFSALGGIERGEQALEGLQSASAFIQRILGKRLRLRNTPLLRFYLDTSWEYGSHIDQLIEQIHNHDHANENEPQ